jgi:NAD(P)-dependent dehydrogenase (short-subunit alcohol dehydrogenase family)
MRSFPPGGLAIVFGASGGIGGALVEALTEQGVFAAVLGLGRRSQPPVDLEDEATIAQAARHAAGLGPPLRLFLNAAGFLHDEHVRPEKSLGAVSPGAMAKAFAVNATGPALLMKHFLPLLPREGKTVFATLSAKVGSIGDNRLGGWHAYRASKAALNQVVRTVAVELARSRPHAAVVALHPGTVRTSLSQPFAKTGLDVIEPAQAAADLLRFIDRLSSESSGGFFTRHGETLPW